MSNTSSGIITLQFGDGTEVQTTLFQLIQWKHTIGLEAKGLRHSRGSVSAHVRKVFNFPPRIKREELIKFINAILEGYKENDNKE